MKVLLTWEVAKAVKVVDKMQDSSEKNPAVMGSTLVIKILAQSKVVVGK